MLLYGKTKKVISVFVIAAFLCVGMGYDDIAFAASSEQAVGSVVTEAADKEAGADKVGKSSKKKKTTKKKVTKKNTKKKNTKKKTTKKKKSKAKTKKKLLKNFKSYKKLRKHIRAIKKAELKRKKQMLKKLKKETKQNNTPDYDMQKPDVVFESSAVKQAAPVSNASAKGSGDHTGTYTQVKGVAEADRIKTDGKYIYYVNFDTEDSSEKVIIVRANGSKVRKVSSIAFDESSRYGYISEIYIKGNKLIIIGEQYLEKDRNSKSPKFDYDNAFSTVAVYDIKNRKKPKKVGTYNQNGYFVSSRMIGNQVYLVSDEYVYDNQAPYVPCIEKKGKIKRIKAKNIYTFPSAKSTNYAVVGSVDIGSGKKMTTRTKAILGASDDIYCSLDNLYIASSSCGYYFDMYDWENVEQFGFNGKTSVMRVALNNGNIAFKAVGSVKGMINNQFSMDENGKYFRIAVTASAKDGEDINYLYVLDENLKKAGRTKGFAKGEHIEAVRFIGDKGYVITYEETDPLFIIDLSKAKEPKIEGSVEITGFSTLLHPVGKTKLLGIGYATEDTGDTMEVQSGIKLALFDIKNSTEPKVLDSKSFVDLYSDVQDDHRAFMVNKKRKYYAVPYYDHDDKGGVICFKIDGSKIKIKKKWESKQSIERCIAIGSYIYALSYEGKLLSFKL